MPNTQLPPAKEKAHEIAKKIANERPLKKDRDAPESGVSGGFNQKSHPEFVDQKQAERDAEDDPNQWVSVRRAPGMKDSERSGIRGA